MSPDDLYLWNQGTLFEAYRHFGAHVQPGGGVRFTVWAPHAEAVSVVTDTTGWDPAAHPLEPVGGGVWQGHVAEAGAGTHYKYHIVAPGYSLAKTDPFAFALEAPHPDGDPIAGMASIVTDLSGFAWTDEAWMQQRRGPSGVHAPMAVLEVHLGSWRKHPDGRSYSYREIAEPLADYATAMGFTHVEFLPLAEHPYYGSWGYQLVGYYAATHRYGSPQDLMYLINHLHTRGLGVLLDWVPAHFAMDPQGLGHFDGRPLFEPDDPFMRTHPDWGTYCFAYDRPEVRAFLVSNALFWLDHYHVDGLRVDAVASMLYRDYSRNVWTPNVLGGREDLDAISLLQTFNTEVFRRYPEAITAAEESTSWPGVTAPVEHGGLGFLYKWNMGWMHDTLKYLAEDPVHRGWHHSSLTFPLVYAWSERYVLPLSHDEVVHLKKSLFEKMPGDDWQKAANLRLLLAHLVGHPGKKLLFMGGEWGQRGEWNHDAELEWARLDDPRHAGLHRFAHDLLHLYRTHPALAADGPETFRWLYADDAAASTAAYTRTHGGRTLLFAFNFTPVLRENVRLGALPERTYRQVLSSDDLAYGGAGTGLWTPVAAHPVPAHGWPGSVVVTLPPLGVLILEAED